MIYDEIKNERQRQDSKWGVQTHAPEKWMVILGEEYGEVCRAILEGYVHDYRKELVHCASVCVAALESLDNS